MATLTALSSNQFQVLPHKTFGACTKRFSVTPSLGFNNELSLQKLVSCDSVNPLQTRQTFLLKNSNLQTPRSSHFVSFASTSSISQEDEEVIFEGGPHVGDLLFNLILGFTFVWLPLTLASVFRNLFLRYRFTNKRVTVTSAISESERKDFPYSAIVDVKSIPRFIGEWGDIAITLSDKTIVELKCVPCFREIAKLALEKSQLERETVSKGDDDVWSKGF